MAQGEGREAQSSRQGVCGHGRGLGRGQVGWRVGWVEETAFAGRQEGAKTEMVRPVGGGEVGAVERCAGAGHGDPQGRCWNSLLFSEGL